MYKSITLTILLLSLVLSGCVKLPETATGNVEESPISTVDIDATVTAMLYTLSNDNDTNNSITTSTDLYAGIDIDATITSKLQLLQEEPDATSIPLLPSVTNETNISNAVMTIDDLNKTRSLLGNDFIFEEKYINQPIQLSGETSSPVKGQWGYGIIISNKIACSGIKKEIAHALIPGQTVIATGILQYGWGHDQGSYLLDDCQLSGFSYQENASNSNEVIDIYDFYNEWLNTKNMIAFEDKYLNKTIQISGDAHAPQQSNGKYYFDVYPFIPDGLAKMFNIRCYTTKDVALKIEADQTYIITVILERVSSGYFAAKDCTVIFD